MNIYHKQYHLHKKSNFIHNPNKTLSYFHPFLIYWLDSHLAIQRKLELNT